MSTAATFQRPFFTTNSKNAYDREEVDAFFRTVNDNYTKMQTAYSVLNEQYNSAIAQNRQQSAELQKARSDLASQRTCYEEQISELKKQATTSPQSTPNYDAISKVLVAANVRAQQIVGNAESEAAQIKATAKKHVDNIVAETDRLRIAIDSMIRDSELKKEPAPTNSYLTGGTVKKENTPPPDPVKASGGYTYSGGNAQ